MTQLANRKVRSGCQSACQELVWVGASDFVPGLDWMGSGKEHASCEASPSSAARS